MQAALKPVGTVEQADFVLTIADEIAGLEEFTFYTIVTVTEAM
jgi:hypothetical protein